MLIYIINRILQIIPVIFILSILVFGFVHALPGDVIDTLTATDGEEDPEVRAALEKEFGLDKPIYVQYFIWIGNVLQGDFGKSLVTRRPVNIELLERIQGKGYGTQWMMEMLKSLQKQGCQGVHLGMHPDNKRALSFYEKLGFEVLEHADLPWEEVLYL